MAGYTGERCQPGDNKEAFDADVFTVYHTLRDFDTRNKNDVAYTVFQTLPQRCAEPGPTRQAFVGVIIH